jgi:hypothetical protein
MAVEPPDPDQPNSPPKKTSVSGRFRWRRILSPLLIILASIILFVSVLAIWIDFAMLDTDEFTETSSEILADEDVQAALAPYLVDQIFSSTDLSARLAQIFPPGLSSLAGPAAAGLEQVATRTATRLLATQQFQRLWTEATRRAHQQFITIVEGDARALATINGEVVLNLQPMVERIFERLGLDPQVVGALPAGRGQIVIMQESQLTSLQKLVDVLQKIAKWFWAFALLFYAAAIWIARGRRREAIRGVGLSFLLVGLGLVVLVRLGGPRLVESLVAIPANEAAALSVWETLTANLRDSARSLLLVGAIILVGAWLVGPGRWATGARRRLAPFGRRPALVYGAVALVVLLILLFVPLRENRSFLSTLVFLGALVLGVETVRRMSIREFPEEGAVPTEDKTVG